MIWGGSLVIAAIIIVAASFYGTTRDPSREATPPPAEDSRKPLRLEIPKPPIAAPEFDLKDAAGRGLTLKKLRGKVVFLNFWATWCPPCIEEMPAMEKLHKELEKDGLVVLAVNFQEGPVRVREFLTKQNFTFAALLDRDGKVAERYQAWALPVSVVINKRGEIAAKAMGARDWAGQESLRFFRELLAE
jgi:peroxiredoxin